MKKENYTLMLEKIIARNKEQHIRPTLLIHACCAPCSSYVLEYLNSYFDINLLFYNPNINTEKEFLFRQSELERLISQMPLEYPVKLIKCDYNSNDFYSAVNGFEECREGGERCFKCYELRLLHTALKAKEMGFDFFCTTLTISPLKNAQKLNEIGYALSDKIGVDFLPSDFKKKNGYKRSIELSKEYNLYRQNYCGCCYSYKESLERTNAMQNYN